MRAAPLALVAGCALDNPRFDEPEVGLTFDLAALEERLSPSAAIVTTDASGPSRSSPGLEIWPLDDGGAAGILWRGVAFDDFYGTYVTAARGLFRASPDGTVTVPVGFGLSASLGDELFVVDCPRVGLTDPVAGFVELAQSVHPAVDPASLCSGALGRGATPDRVLQVDSSTGGVNLHELDRAAGTDTVSAAPSVSVPAGASVVLVSEPVAGEVSLLLALDGGLALDGVPVTGIGTLADVTAWLAADGAVRIATADGLYRVDAASGAATLIEAVPASPTGTAWTAGRWPGGAYAEAGDPNPDAPEVTIPTAMAVRSATDDGFEVLEPPLTPCCDREACRELGESYLLGGIGGTVAYDLWSWVGDDSTFTHVGTVRSVDDCGN